MRDINDLRQRQSLPLGAKVLMTQARIREWYDHYDGNVCVSFSGGKDSTVLAHLVHDLYPEVPLVFCNTGLEYPEIQKFAKENDAEFVYPKMNFSEVISNYGYPIISKENAEAIHYARKICNGGVERKKESGMNLKEEDVTGLRIPPKIAGGGNTETAYPRANLTAVPYRCIKEELDGEGQHLPENCAENHENTGSVRRNRGSWEQWRRRTIAGVGEFSAETKSIFNKEKWLPLCRDTQFKISHKCCSVMKKSPMGIYQRKHKSKPFLGTLADESRLREQAWIRHGCNAFDASKQTSQPMSFWLEQDVLQYIKEEGLQIASVYGDIVTVDADGMEYDSLLAPCGTLKCTGCQRTGCIFCGFGAHLDKGESRFQRLAKTHPKQYEYCMRGGQWVENPDYDPTAPKYDGDWLNWNPKKIWVPSKKGLGMAYVFDQCNQIYGNDFIKYE